MVGLGGSPPEEFGCTVCLRVYVLGRLINTFRFPPFLLWFVLGPGGFWEGTGGPQKANGRPSETSRGPPEHPGPGPKNLRNHTFYRVLFSGRV